MSDYFLTGYNLAFVAEACRHLVSHSENEDSIKIIAEISEKILNKSVLTVGDTMIIASCLLSYSQSCNPDRKRFEEVVKVFMKYRDETWSGIPKYYLIKFDVANVGTKTVFAISRNGGGFKAGDRVSFQPEPKMVQAYSGYAIVDKMLDELPEYFNNDELYEI
jgi:hypothetical protein